MNGIDGREWDWNFHVLRNLRYVSMSRPSYISGGMWTKARNCVRVENTRCLVFTHLGTVLNATFVTICRTREHFYMAVGIVILMFVIFVGISAWWTKNKELFIFNNTQHTYSKTTTIKKKKEGGQACSRIAKRNSFWNRSPYFSCFRWRRGVYENQKMNILIHDDCRVRFVIHMSRTVDIFSLISTCSWTWICIASSNLDIVSEVCDVACPDTWKNDRSFTYAHSFSTLMWMGVPTLGA